MPLIIKQDLLSGLHPLDGLRQQAETIIEAMFRAKRIIVVTGAGISVSGGIPDFRSMNGLYNIVKEKYPDAVMKGKDLFDAGLFSDPESTRVFYAFMSQLKEMVEKASCTPVHHFIKSLLDSSRLLRCYTQNIDCLEERLGMHCEVLDQKSKVVLLHGSLKNVICTVCKTTAPFSDEFKSVFREGQAPTCGTCVEKSEIRVALQKRSLPIGFLRPDIILYNEHHAAGDWIAEMAAKDMRKRPDMLIVMGTSLKVAGIKKLVKDLSRQIHSTATKQGKISTVLINKTDVSLSEWNGVFDAKWMGDADDIVKFIDKGFADRSFKLEQRRKAKAAKENQAANQSLITEVLLKVKKALPSPSAPTKMTPSKKLPTTPKAGQTKALPLLSPAVDIVHAAKATKHAVSRSESDITLAAKLSPKKQRIRSNNYYALYEHNATPAMTKAAPKSVSQTLRGSLGNRTSSRDKTPSFRAKKPVPGSALFSSAARFNKGFVPPHRKATTKKPMNVPFKRLKISQMTVESDAEDELQLSGAALSALQSFYDEQRTLQEQLSKLHDRAESDFQKRLTMDLFQEDWQLSQFWYNDDTASVLADFLASGSSAVCISAPTAFVKYKEKYPEQASCTLFEFDTRFAVFRDEFMQYDYNKPLELDGLSPNSFEVLLADPPFLSEECMKNTCETIRFLASPNARIMICTGATMAETVAQLIPGMRETTFHPRHKSGLSNEFRCYTNFENAKFTWIN